MKKIVLTIIVVLVVGIAIALGLNVIDFNSNRQDKLQSLQSAFDTNDFDAAISDANALAKKNPNDIDALLVLAATYAQKGSITFKEEENAKLAIEYAQKALLVDPNNSEAYRIIGYAYEIQEKYEDAHINYDKAISLNPNNSLALSNKGHAYDLQGNLKAAEEWYRNALSVNPANEHALLNLARVEIRLDKNTDAKVYIDSLISTSKNKSFLAEGYQLLAEIYKREDNYTEALSAISMAIQNDSNQPQAWVTKGQIEMMAMLDATTDAELNKIVDSVSKDAKKALEINKNQTTAYMLLADLMIPIGNTAKNAEYKALALQSIDQDITLGQKEKEGLKLYLNASIKTESK